VGGGEGASPRLGVAAAAFAFIGEN
jgi:hypothetical protein